MHIEQLLEYDSIEYREMTELYKISFPLEERAPIEIMDARFQAKGHQVYITKQKTAEHEKTIAFAVVYPFQNVEKICLLDYFAIDPTLRGQGIGSEFLQMLFQELIEKQRIRYILIEVDDPRYGTDTAIRTKRVQFYKRLGCKEIDSVRYYLPSFAGRLPIEMILMIYPHPQKNQFLASQLKTLIRELYVVKYHQKSDLPLLLEILTTIPSKLQFL